MHLLKQDMTMQALRTGSAVPAREIHPACLLACVDKSESLQPLQGQGSGCARTVSHTHTHGQVRSALISFFLASRSGPGVTFSRDEILPSVDASRKHQPREPHRCPCVPASRRCSSVIGCALPRSSTFTSSTLKRAWILGGSATVNEPRVELRT